MAETIPGMPRSSTADLPDATLAAIEAFGTPARVAIIEALRTYEPTTKAHIAEVLDMEYKTALYHMAILERLGVIVPEVLPGRKQPLHSVDSRRVKQLSRALAATIGA